MELKTVALSEALKHLCDHNGEDASDLVTESNNPPIAELKKGLREYAENPDSAILVKAMTTARDMIIYSYAGSCPDEVHDALAIMTLNRALRPD